MKRVNCKSEFGDQRKKILSVGGNEMRTSLKKEETWVNDFYTRLTSTRSRVTVTELETDNHQVSDVL